jgi:hypothetical protein
VSRRRDQVEAAQVAFESRVRKRFTVLWLQALRSRRFQRGLNRVKLHRPTRSVGSGRWDSSDVAMDNRSVRSRVVAAQVEIESET